MPRLLTAAESNHPEQAAGDNDVPLSQAALWERYRYHLLVERHRAALTVKAYREVLYRFWRFLRPKGPERAVVRDLHRFLRRSQLAPNTEHGYGTIVRSFYRWAHLAGIYPKDRMAAYFPPKKGIPIPRARGMDEIARVFDYWAGSERMTLMLWLAYGCGLRAGEVASLRIEGCELHAATPHIRVMGKGSKPRIVPLAPAVARALELYLAGRPRTGPVVTSHLEPGQPLHPRSVSRLLCHALQDAGIPATGHQLRHTFATELLRADEGRNIRAVSRLLGHANLATTQVYTLAYDADAEKAVLLLPDPRGSNLKRRRDAVEGKG